ncbi:hypothetical protein [Cytobacillus sp. NCCP-133]|uniref:hypothetical protein n=1 Tax=Cytobacillus sp. NCCP-133 TaxID=766848 RepID=UPI00222EDF09|nr:hypothetical protein [Cytobacillus sp. NCCP-133]GLB61753.1 hypothetical protein NCCP133_38820 [Cytobacillus sp. NCCP-133]
MAYIDIQAQGAKIICKGDIHYVLNYEQYGVKYKYTVTVVPMAFINCKNVKITGLELEGQVNLDTNVVEDEGANHGFQFSGCENVTLLIYMSIISPLTVLCFGRVLLMFLMLTKDIQ